MYSRTKHRHPHPHTHNDKEKTRKSEDTTEAGRQDKTSRRRPVEAVAAAEEAAGGRDKRARMDKQERE